MLKFIPGFKTGKKWKSIMAVLFYLTLFVVLLNPIGVTIRDKIIFIFNYLILAGTPFVLLLNFGSIRSKLPLFKSKSIKGTILGVISTLILITVVVASTSALKSPEQKRLDYIASQQAEEEQRIKANDEKFAKNIDEKITALGRIKNISLFQSDEISKLFQDYEALTSNQKKFIKEYDTLVAAQKKIHDLESEKIAAEKTAAAEAAAAEEAAEKAAAEEAAAEEAAAEEAAAEEAAAEKAAAEKAAAEEAAAEEAAAEEKPNLFSKVMKDDGLIDDLVKSLKAIGISPEKVKNLKQLDDWVGGSRYSFVYDGMELLVYSRTDSTVESIRYGLDTDIYKKGYEPYNISDFYFDDSLYSTLTMKAENKVKSKLNYPATAKFSRTGWGRSRNHDLYSVSSSVTAKNAFGVEEVLPFLLTYQVVDDKAKLVYFELGNEVITDNLEAVRLTERKKLAALQKPVGSTEERITIVEGQIGKYGKEVTINGYESIQYRIPEGKYTVTNQVNYCKVFIAKNKLITNSDGVKERRIIDTIELTSNGQTEEITIKSDEHLFVTAYSTISLEKSN